MISVSEQEGPQIFLRQRGDHTITKDYSYMTPLSRTECSISVHQYIVRVSGARLRDRSHCCMIHTATAHLAACQISAAAC